MYPVLGTPGILKFARPSGQTGQSVFAGRKWDGQKVLWVAAPSYEGSVLIRGRQWDGSHAIGFGPGAVPIADLQLRAAGATSPGEPPG